MAYTVGLPGGTREYEHGPYLRMLEKEGVDVVNTTRVADPETGKRWLHVWPTKEEASRFAEKLKAETENPEWEVFEVSNAAPSTGPLGPIVILVSRNSDGLSYSLSYSSEKLIRKRFPQVSIIAPNMFISTNTLYASPSSQGSIWDQVAIILTGLPMSKIEQLGGYQIYEPETKSFLSTTPLVA